MLLILMERRSGAVLVLVLIVKDGTVYASAAAWVPRDVGVLALNMRIQAGGEGGDGGEGGEGLVLRSMGSFFLFRIKSDRKPCPKRKDND
jgi:hypothetical protein